MGVYGVYDLASHWNHDLVALPFDPELEKLLGTTPVDDRKIYLEASPINYVVRAKNKIAFFLSWGTADDTALPSQSENFRDALKQANFFVRTAPGPGAPHFWMYAPMDEPGSLTAIARDPHAPVSRQSAERRNATHAGLFRANGRRRSESAQPDSRVSSKHFRCGITSLTVLGLFRLGLIRKQKSWSRAMMSAGSYRKSGSEMSHAGRKREVPAYEYYRFKKFSVSVLLRWPSILRSRHPFDGHPERPFRLFLHVRSEGPVDFISLFEELAKYAELITHSWCNIRGGHVFVEQMNEASVTR